MLKRLQQFAWLLIILITFFTAQLQNVQAQAISQSIAMAIDLQEKANEGDIIVLTDSGYKISTDPKQSNIIGVVNFSPPVLIKDKSFNGNNSYTPVVTSGVTSVNVSTQTGEIKTGDLISVSSTKGVGQKSTETGFILGKALEDLSANKTGKINVLIDIYFNTVAGNTSGTNVSGVFGLFQLSTAEVYKEPTKALRYLIASIIIIASFIFGFASFGSIARNGIEALGRNPLASKKIQLGIFFNSSIAIAIIAGGVIFAVIIAVY